MERGANFARQHTLDEEAALPIVICGDFNSKPISSVMSLFHDEDIEGFANRHKADMHSQWLIPSA